MKTFSRFARHRSTARRFQPFYLIWPLLLLAIIIGWLVYLDYRDTERELQRLLAENADTLLDACSTTIVANEQAFTAVQQELARRLLGNARFLAGREAAQELEAEFLEEFAASNELYRIHLFDAGGALERSVPASAPAMIPPAWPVIFTPLLDGQLAEMVVGSSETRYGSDSRFVAAVSRPHGGLIVVTVRGELLDQFRREMGLGQALQALADHPSVAFLLVQDEDGPISVSPPVETILAIEADPFLREAFAGRAARTRFVMHQGQEILEVARRILIEPEYNALLRLGLTLDFYHRNLADLAQRDLILGLAFFMGGGLLLGLAYSVQNYRFLHSRYIRSLQMAGHITENMQEAMLLLRTDGFVAGMNQRARNWFRLREDEAMDADLRRELAAAGIHPSTAEEDSGYLPWRDKILLCRKQLLPASPAESSRDWLFLFLDVTTQRQTEQKLRREERLAALGRLISGVAHEIRNPLNALALSVQNMQRHLRTATDPRTLNSIRIVEEEIRRLDRLVEDFLSYARPVAPDSALLSLKSLVDSVCDLFAAEADEKQISLQVTPAADSAWPTVQADEERLRQVLINIIRNSFDALGNGGTIHIELSVTADHYRLNLRDSGPGFSHHALRHATEPFFTTKEKGTGLGLSLSEDILQRHGWTLEVGNTDSGGAHITVIIPKRKDHEPESPDTDRR
ncbi:MAG: hypothetical protein JXQ27_16560 [Acidobacteria bacterium]|nr:hypothetical protein [Acidobacteriota bacterium]